MKQNANLLVERFGFAISVESQIAPNLIFFPRFRSSLFDFTERLRFLVMLGETKGFREWERERIAQNIFSPDLCKLISLVQGRWPVLINKAQRG